MSLVILYIDAVENSVKITKEARQIPEFEDLYNGDKTSGKSFFEAAINFIYYVYCKGEKGSPFQNMPFSQRCTLAAYDKFVGKKKEPEEFLNHPNIKKAIYAFNKYTKTQTERFEERLFEDMDNTIKHLNDIPMTKTVKVEVDVNAGTEENPILKRKKVDIEFSNSEEKMRLYKSVKDILFLKKEYSELIRVEQVDQMKESEYLFERKKDGA